MSRRRGWRHKQSRRVPLVQRLLRNRYSGSNWVSVADVISNIRETWFCFTHRVPPGSRLFWRNGRIAGYTRSWNGPR